MSREKERLRILITDPHLFGGGQITYVCKLSQGLIKRGHEVVVGCKKGSVFVELSKTYGYKVIDEFFFKGGLRIISWLRDISKFKEILKDLNPDIIHVNGSQDHWTAAIVNSLLNHKYCIVRTRHNTYKVSNHFLNKWLNINATDYHIAVCEFVMVNLIENNGFPREIITAIHNGVDVEEFRANEELRKKAREEFGFTPDDIVFGISARLNPAKGHKFLIQAVKKISSFVPNIKVLILGQGILEEELKQLTKDLKLEDVIKFGGYRKDMAYCTQAFDVAVMPSIDCDTSSFSLKEAMAEGKPVIASDYGGLPEIITDGVEGIIVPAGTVEPLAEAIKTLATNPELRKKMGERAFQRATSNFSSEQFVDKTIKTYLHALKIHYAHSTH
ncbi:MAG: glycosyltransferase family 4 protein [Candidatus Hydrogenedentes bacterium]|nr:glycosyltransferase family 4 protein [Candidatus Hydrogenedentota bacterium]